MNGCSCVAVFVAAFYFGPWWLAVLLGGFAFWMLKGWWDGWRGRKQWPTAHGRYYTEWLRLPVDQGHGDYYQWLAKKMGDREPWRTWAAWERAENKADEAADAGRF